jgi:hypothetical protein
MRLYLQKEITRAKWTVIEHLLCKWEALSSNPSPTKNNNNNTKKKREREREKKGDNKVSCCSQVTPPPGADLLFCTNGGLSGEGLRTSKI